MNFIKPMNAVDLSRQDVKKKVDKLHHVLTCGEYFLQHKIQGNRMDIVFQRNGNRLITRGGHYKDACMPQLTIPIDDLHGTQLTGELFHPDYTDNQLAGLLGRGPKGSPTLIDPVIMKEMRLYIFDVLTWRGKETYHASQLERVSMLMEMKPRLEAENYHIRILPSMEFRDPMIALEEFDKVVKAGGEGLMFKQKDAVYQPGKRPENTWYKLKKTFTEDVFIIGYKAGQGKYEGLIGSVLCGAYKNGQVVEVCYVSGFDDKTRIDISENKQQWLGRVIEICGFVKTESSRREGRYIRVREDKQPRECVIDEDTNTQ